MFFRVFIPRTCRNIGHVIKPIRNISKLYGRDIPIFPRRRHHPSEIWGDVWHRFAPPTMMKEMNKQFTEMQKFMDQMMPRYNERYCARSRPDTPGAHGEATQVRINSNVLEVKLDVSDFKPEELKVTITENKLLISGRHEQRADDHGFISREFTREFPIPENIDSESISSMLSEEGILFVKGQPKEVPKVEERVIDIQREDKATAGGNNETSS